MPALPAARRLARAGRAREGRAASATRRTGAGRCPGFGDPDARILLVGLAPGRPRRQPDRRVFTGDASGDFLFAAMHAVGLANQPTGRRADDGLTLTDAYIAAAVRCAPPANKPTPRGARQLRAVTSSGSWRSLDRRPRARARSGAFAWEAALRTIAALTGDDARPRPRFGHGAEARVGRLRIVGSYHPSQQNTFTGRLTQPMLGRCCGQALGPGVGRQTRPASARRSDRAGRRRRRRAPPPRR